VAKLVLALGIFVSFVGSTSGQPFVFYASGSGHQTLDQGEGGGNPFASSLVEILQQNEMRLADFPETLRALTVKKSQGFQTPDVPKVASAQDWKLVPWHSNEKRIALVLVVSNYEGSGVSSLPGAAHDARRMAAALAKAGFETELALDLDLSGMREKLTEFETASSGSDVAAIYTTGHGIEFNGVAYIVPGDFPLSLGNTALRSKALPLPEIEKAVHARKINLVFYGGCRDNPLAE
jgi:hypothetical protein